MQKLFKLFVGIWIAILVGIVFCNPFNYLPVGVMILGVIFLAWFGFIQVAPQVNWYDWFDWSMGYCVVSFFGSALAFILPCLYELEVSLKWNDWSQWMLLIWLVTILYGLIATLVKQYRSIGAWRFLIIGMILLVAAMFILSCLGFFFHIYVR